MNYLVDQQLPAALARSLTAAGRDAVHVLDIGLAQADDLTIWDHALSQGRIVISKDEDFFHLANRRDDSGRLLWLRIGNTRKGHLLETVLSRLEEIERLFNEGQRIVEIRA